MKLLIENFKKFLHENDDSVWDKLKSLLLNGRASQAFELAASIDDKLLRDLLLEYAKMWHYTKHSDQEFADQGEEEPEWIYTFVDSHDVMTISELDEILKKIEEILSVSDEYYDDDDLYEIYSMQSYIKGRKKTVKLFGPRKG
jgi:excinuclease UvrABC nuclease subunit